MQAYKFPSHFVELLLGSPKNSPETVMVSPQGHIVIHHYSKSLTVSSCNLNWFDTAV